MTSYIIKRYLSANNASGRRKAGMILSAVSIFLNLLLFFIKYAGGRLSGSVAITADGFNNLADTCSGFLTLLGLKLGGKPSDDKYPMGYGRLEYLSGLVISAAILLIGGRMLLSSVDKLLHPEPIDGSLTVILLLCVSILIKGYMYRYNSKLGKLIHSSAMRAAALDSLSDCFATFAILAAVIIERSMGFNADGYTGILVASCIIYAGIASIRESVEPLLGKAIDEATMEKLVIIISRHRDIRSVSRVLLHDYGPGRRLLTFYIDSDRPIELIHALREEISERLEVEAVISPLTPGDSKNPIVKNKAAVNSQKYNQTQKNQEREANEHQTR